MPFKKKKPKTLPFVMLEHEIWQSTAWKKLNGSSVRLYIFIRSEAWGRFNDARTKIIKVSYSEMEKATGLSTQSVRKAIVQLENIGFIDFVEQGGLKSAGYSKNRYKLSIRYLKYDMHGFEKGKLKEAHNITDRGFGQHKRWKNHKGNDVDGTAEGVKSEENQTHHRPKLVIRMADS
jgi:hypothetical protein